MKNTIRFFISFLAFVFIVPLNGQFQIESFSVPRFREAKAMYWQDEENFVIIGGNLTNDNITSVFVKTPMDNDLKLYFDKIGPQLNDLWVGDEEFIAVGNNNLIYQGKDVFNVDDWSEQSVNDVTDFNLKKVEVQADTIWLIGNNTNTGISRFWYSVDGGNTYTTTFETTSSRFESFVKEGSKIIICGSNGNVFYSANNGQSFNKVALKAPTDITFYSVQYDSDHWFAFGGVRGKDSIQYVVKSKLDQRFADDVIDIKGPCLIGAKVKNAGEVWVVGEDGFFGSYSPQNNTLTSLNLPEDMSEGYDLNNISFLNSYHSSIIGTGGKVLILKDTSSKKPLVFNIFNEVNDKQDIGLKYEVIPNSDTARFTIKYKEWNSSEEKVAFSNKLEGSYSRNVGSVINLGSGYFNVWAEISNELGTNISETIKLFTGSNEIPNHSFEYWNDTSWNVVADWNYSGSVKWEFYNNDTGVLIESKKTFDDELSVVFHGSETGADDVAGGVKFIGDITDFYLKGRFYCGSGDSLCLYYEFKDNNGAVLLNKKQRFTGKFLNDTILRFSVPAYSGVIDTLKLAVLASDFFNGTRNDSNWIWLDSIWTNVAGNNQIPNAGFSKSERKSFSSVIGWSDPGQGYPYTRDSYQKRITNSIDGDYAMELIIDSSASHNSVYLESTTDTTDAYNRYDIPDFPISYSYGKLVFYTQFAQAEMSDTCEVQVTFFNGRKQVAWGHWVSGTSTSDWKKIEIPLIYDQSPLLPDSAKIRISLRCDSGQIKKPSAKFDNFYFDYSPTNRDLDFVSVSKVEQSRLSIFPNPTDGILNIQSTKALQFRGLYDVLGKSINVKITKLNESMFISTDSLSSGTYIVIIKNGIRTEKIRFIKK